MRKNKRLPTYLANSTKLECSFVYKWLDAEDLLPGLQTTNSITPYMEVVLEMMVVLLKWLSACHDNGDGEADNDDDDDDDGVW